MSDAAPATSNPAQANGGGAQANNNSSRGGRGGGRNGGRGPRKAPSTSGPPADPAIVAASGGPAGAPGAGQNAGGNRSRNNNRQKASPNPATAALASEESLSRPSSTDGSNRNTNNRGKSRSASTGGGKPSAPSGNQRGKTRTASTNSPNPPKANLTGGATPNQGPVAGSAALTSLQRVITDLKAANAAPVPQNGAAASTAPTVSPITTSSLPINAPVFQPGASLHPALGAAVDSARQRKGANGPSYNSPSFSSPLNAFSPGLGVMQEDIAEEHEDDDGDIVVAPSQVPMQAQRGIVQSNMGNFTAPRFNNMPQSGGGDQTSPQDAMGRPQLAPNFTFGQRRNPINPVSGIGDEDAGFQFPQAGQQPELPQPNSHRRTPSELAGVSPLMAEQVWLDNLPTRVPLIDD